MVLALAQTLEIPLRERNRLLTAAGFAAAYGETPLPDASLEPVMRALEFMLSASQPHPCFVVNRRYDMLMVNRPGHWMLDTFTEDPTLVGQDCNMVRLLTEPRGMGRFIGNRDDVLRKVLARVRRDLSPGHPRDAVDRATLARADAAWAELGGPSSPDLGPVPMIGLRLVRDDLELDLFTAIATLGTPLDVTLQEIRIETFFPSNDPTRRVLAQVSTAIGAGA